MNAFKVVLEIAIAFVIGAGIITVINWKTAQTKLSTLNGCLGVQIELDGVNPSRNG